MAQATDAAQQLVIPRGKEAVMRQFATMAAILPKADDSEAGFDIVGRILAGESINDLDAPWNDTADTEMTGRTIVIHGATVRESDFSEGLGVYLRIDYTDARTGEVGTFSTGAMSIIAQLVKAYQLDALPFVALVVEETSKAGYHPQHLEILDDQSAARDPKG